MAEPESNTLCSDMLGLDRPNRSNLDLNTVDQELTLLVKVCHLDLDLNIEVGSKHLRPTQATDARSSPMPNSDTNTHTDTEMGYRRAKFHIRASFSNRSRVHVVRKEVARAIDRPECEIELLYRGKFMKDDQTLQSYGVRPLVTLFALQKSGIQKNSLKADGMENESLQQVSDAIQTALANSTNSSTVEKVLRKSDMLENIVAATPGLASDPVALGILSVPDILPIMMNPAQIKRVIELHPTLGRAVMMVFAAVNEEVANGDLKRDRSSETFSLDQMSDEEDIPTGQITASQLAVALAAAEGSMAASPVLHTNDRDSSSVASDPAISTEFFRQAMAVASGRNDPVTQAQLRQMHSMGISDESIARQALEAAGGDLQAALEIIFGNPNL